MKRGLFYVLMLVFAFAKAQSNPTQVSMYLDASLSMEGRNMAVEMEYLETFFGEHPYAEVDFVSFSNTVLYQESYVVEQGDWYQITERLIMTNYDGATAFDILDFSKKTDYYLLLTDGKSAFDSFPKTASAPVVILNSIPVKAALHMKLLAAQTGGSYNVLKSASGVNPPQITTIRGKVTTTEDGETIGLVGARVQVIGETTQVATDSEGNFSISAKPGDVIIVTHIGKKLTKKRVVRGKSMNVFLPFEGDALDEVILTIQLEPEDALVYIGNEKKSKKKITYAVQSISENEISPLDLDAKQAVKGQFSNLEIANDAATTRVDLTQFLGRHKNMTILGDQYGLVVIDGMATAKSSSASNTQTLASTLHIDPNNIADITYLKGLTATNRYGTLGKNGVILITTKAYATHGTKDLSVKRKEGTTGYYSDESSELDELPNVSYINELLIAQDIDTAYTIYLEQRKFFGDLVSFYVDVASYFRGWGNQLLVTRILSNLEEKFADDPTALYTASFKYEEFGNILGAIQSLRMITQSFPNQMQAQRDLALLQSDLGAIEDAKEQYINLWIQCQEKGMSAASFTESVGKEFQNFVAKYRDEVQSTKLPPMSTRVPEVLERRIVVSWSDPRSLFDLQIVNPQNRFFTWNHTMKNAGRRLLQEKSAGFSMEDFFLTSGDQGTWKFNVVNYGFTKNDKGQPSFLKFTVYDNYGSPSEKKTVKVVRLEELDTPFTVLSITI
ncbi:MAG: hypothetical protein ACI828_001538 [Flavobacteriales bacterium]|jgi:hypothetical protein